MPTPEPKQGETQEDFLGRCMADETMVAEYEDTEQRYAVCMSAWEQSQEAARSRVDELTGEVETRTFLYSELRLLDMGEGLGRLRGAPGIPYNQSSENLGGFVERISPTALDKTLGQYDVVCCRDHEDHLVLGRVSAGTLVLENTRKGLNYECVLPDVTYARDLVESIRRGDVRGSSFRFHVLKDSWEPGRGGFDRRTILEMELYEVGPVTMPAYPSTALSLRSLLRGVGVDAQNLAIAVRRARSGALRGQDIDAIASAIEALKECLPPSGQGTAGVAECDRQGLEILRQRLETLEI